MSKIRSKQYSEYLTFRSFWTGVGEPVDSRRFLNNVIELQQAVATMLRAEARDYALLLSGGMDSAVLLPFMPPGAVAYTLYHPRSKDNEVEIARAYCQSYGVEHRVLPIDPHEYLEVIDPLMANKNMPLSPAEPQFYIAARAIKADGFGGVVTGGGADTKLGGFPGLRKTRTANGYLKLLHKKYLDPKVVLKDGVHVGDVMECYSVEDEPGVHTVDGDRFLAEVGVERFAFDNAISAAGLRHLAPFARLGIRFDREKNKARPKYVLRKMYKNLYGMYPPKKKGFQKPSFLLNDYSPTSPIFEDFDVGTLKYPQKFLVYCLERFHALYG